VEEVITRESRLGYWNFHCLYTEQSFNVAACLKLRIQVKPPRDHKTNWSEESKCSRGGSREEEANLHVQNSLGNICQQIGLDFAFRTKR